MQEPPLARLADPATSKLAAAALSGSARLLNLRGRVLGWLLAHPEGGDFGVIANGLGLNEMQVWRRCSDLKNAGLAFQSGTTRSAHTGRLRGLWRATGQPALPFVPAVKHCRGMEIWLPVSPHRLGGVLPAYVHQTGAVPPRA